MKKFGRLTLIFLFLILAVVPVKADNTTWIQDSADKLTSDEEEKLSDRITELADTYDVGIYLYTVTSRDSDSIETYAEEVYTADDLGLGSDSSGILLIMDFSDRSYDIAAYGSAANTCFTDYAKNRMEDAMLDDFSNDDWYDGYDAYLDEVETDLYYGITKDDPIDYGNDHMTLAHANTVILLTSIIAPLCIAFIVCLILASKNKTARKAVSAAAYTGTINLTRHDDIFTHVTRSVVHINRDSGGGPGGGGGGTSINSGGFSHSSGHF